MWKNETYDQPHHFPAFKRPGTYEVEVTSEYSSATDELDIEADFAEPDFDRADVSRDTFFPRVNDGHRDRVVARWRTNRGLFGSIAVVNTVGATVATWPERSWKGDQQQAWDGRDEVGRALPTGRYRIRLTARDADGRTVTRTLPVTIGRGSGR